MGIRGFFTPAGVGTLIAEGKEVRNFDQPCILELPLHADLCNHQGSASRRLRQLLVPGGRPKFFPLMAMAARTTIVEVEELVELGDIRPEDVHLPGVLFQRVYQGDKLRKCH